MCDEGKETISLINPVSVTSKPKIRCINCMKSTYHEFHTGLHYIHHDDNYATQEIWELFSCNGCKTLTLQIKAGNTDECGYIEDEFIFFTEKKFYPPRNIIQQALSTNEQLQLPPEIRSFYNEVYGALTNDYTLLAMMGMRSIIQMICKNKGFAQGELYAQINQLKAAGHITVAQCDFLHNLRNMGNDTTHDAKVHTPDNLKTAFDIINHLVNQIYLLPKKASQLPKKEPPHE